MACARSAAVGQLGGISIGTTPRRYRSSASSFTTVTRPVRTRRRTPRYVSYRFVFESSWSRVADAVGRTRMSGARVPEQRTVPVVDLTWIADCLTVVPVDE